MKIISINTGSSSLKFSLFDMDDKKGEEAANMEVSQKRAETIKKLLIEEGVHASQIEGAEGYGAKFAQVAADATDEERAKDRRIALRFEK